ncbi:MAG: VCBS repeat-containing protein [Bacteroidota bacterium]
MKLSKEEKPVWKIDLIIINSILILSFFSSSLIYSQIPINGFCSFKEFRVNAGQIRFLPVDFNSDGWRDLIIFNGRDRSYSSQLWDKNKFTSPAAKYLSTSVYGFHLVGSNDSRRKRYAFISRKDREAGFLTFNKSGNISIQSRIKFDSYPSSIDAADVKRNGKAEILISGVSFKGLSIISEDKNKLKEIIIDPNNLYSSSLFFDLDYDGYMDIIAIDMLKNSAVLFYNDRAGNFRRARSLSLSSELKEFYVADFTNNGYDDLIFTNETGFEVFQGDSVSSFKKKISLKTPENPDKYVVMDFNGDGFNDVAYINLQSGNLYISFARSVNDFYHPIIYFQRKGIVDISAYVDRSGRKLALLDSNGKIYFVEKVTSAENLAIPLAIKPDVVGSFSDSNTRMKGLFFIDNENFRINFLLSGKNVFDFYFTQQLSKNYSSVVVDEVSKDQRNFYFYSKGDKVIEIIRANFARPQFSRKVLYANGQIYDLKITSDRLKDMQTIYVLSENGGKLFIESFDFRDFRYVNSGYAEIATDVELASLTFGLYKEIFFIKKSGEDFLLKKSIFNRKVQSEEIIVKKSASGKGNVYSDIASFEDGAINENTTAAWFYDKNNTDILFYIKSRPGGITLKDFYPAIGSMKYLDGENENSIFLYDRSKGKLKRIDITNFGRNIVVKDLFESKNINNYIVDRLNSKKEFLIYTDNSDNLLKMKHVK